MRKVKYCHFHKHKDETAISAQQDKKRKYWMISLIFET